MKSRDAEDDDRKSGGLLCGLTPYHVRVLADSSWEGGRGIGMHDIPDMTLDQIFMMLAQRKILRRDGTGQRKLCVASGFAPTDENGVVRGRDAKGRPIRGRVIGKSVARRLMEEEHAKQMSK